MGVLHFTKKPMQLPTENLTFEALLTLGGLTLAVYLVTTAIRQVWPAAPTKVVGFIVSLVLTVALLAVNGDYSGPTVTTAVVNAFLAFLVFLTAAGFSLSLDATIHAFSGAPSELTAAGAERRRWWTAWV